MRLARRERYLLVVFGAVALFQALRMTVPYLRSGDLSLAGGRSALHRAAEEATMVEVSNLQLDALFAGASELVVGRNPFRYAAAPPPPPPPRVERPKAPPRLPAPPRDVGPRPPDVDLTYLGSFGPDRHRIAVFSDGETIYNATQGDTLQGKFIVHQIGYESVDLRFVNFPEVAPERLAVGG